MRASWLRWLRPPRKLRPTREGVWFLGGTLAVGFAAVNTGNNLLFLILGLLLATIIASGVLSEHNLRNLKIRREAPEGTRARQAGSLWVTVENRKSWLPTMDLTVHEVSAEPGEAGQVQFPMLEGGAVGRKRCSVTYPRRGVYNLGDVEISTTWPFGLFRKSRVIEAPDEVVVWPARAKLLTDMWSNAADRGFRASSRRGHGVELFGLRPYLPGEDARLIYWKASARSGEPMAREAAAEESHVVVLLVEPGLVGDDFEGAIEQAAALAEVLTQAGHRVGVVAGMQSVAPVAGATALRRIMGALAVSQPGPGAGVPVPGAVVLRVGPPAANASHDAVQRAVL